METIIASLISAILSGGQTATLALCGLFAFIMWSDKNRALEVVSKLHERLDIIGENYTKGQITITDAIREVRVAIYESRRAS